MPRFYPLTVTDVRKTTRDAVVVSLQPKDGGDFGFIQGQYLTFRRDFDGVEIRRSYSICAGRNDGLLQVGIKRVEGGAFSTWANEALKPGDTIDAMQPMGNFHTPLQPARAKSYLGFAAGSGITPILSILKTVLEEEPESTFTLVYGNRRVNTIMFREELEDLKNRFIGRLSIIHILGADTQDIDLFTGRIDADKCRALFAGWIDVSSVDTAFICGPEPLMLTISETLKDHGLGADQIKFELFASRQPGRLARRAAPANGHSSGRLTEVRATLDGAAQTFSMNRDTSILDAALANALDVPYACRAGVCSTCMCRVLDGEVEMIANHALEDYEIEQGYILSCQSYPLTEQVVIDYDRGH